MKDGTIPAVSAEGSENLFLTKSQTIFKKHSLEDEDHDTQKKEALATKIVGGSKYGQIGFRKVLGPLFNNYSIADVQTPFVVPAYSWRTRSSYVFRNSNPDMHHHKLTSVPTASSSAPYYFTPHLTRSYDGTRHALIDGGLVCNTPALYALEEAKRLYPNDELVLISIGTGGAPAPISEDMALKVGLFHTMRELWNYAASGGTSHVKDILQYRQEAGEVQVFDFDFDFMDCGAYKYAEPSRDIDDTSPKNLRRLSQCANIMFDKNFKQLEALGRLIGRRIAEAEQDLQLASQIAISPEQQRITLN